MLTRRQLLFTAIAGGVTGQPKKRPNVLFIATDDMNAALGCYGHPVVKSPNIDRLAARGVRFDRAYTQYAFCSPSRTSLMTGLAPDTTSVYDLVRHFRTQLPDVVTLSQCFQKNGYYTARVGKIFHYGNPGQIGTDGLDDAPSWNHKVNPAGVDKLEEEPMVTNHSPQIPSLGSALCFYASPQPDEKHTDGIVADETIRLLEQNKDKPFFIAAGFYKPHTPYIAPKKYFDMYPAAKMEPIPFKEGDNTIAAPWAYTTSPPNRGMSRQQTQEVLQAYYACISFVDANVGKLMAALERLGLAENTIVVFWSDHGYAIGEHGQWQKQMVFESATRIPLLFAGPGVSKDRVCGRTVEMLDFYPTLTGLCGLNHVPGNLHGKSLQPLLKNPSIAWDRPAVSQVRRGGGGNGKKKAGKLVTGYSIRNERYRYTEWNGGEEGWEMYDYQTDRGETKNLGQDPATAKLRSDLQRRLHSITKARGKA